MKLDVNKIKNKIKNTQVLEGRGKIYKIRYKKFNFNLIDESYNANPLSMKQSIQNLSNIRNNNHNISVRRYVGIREKIKLFTQKIITYN